MTPDDVLARLMGEAQAELEAALAERPALAAEDQATRRAHEDADNVFQNFVLRVNLATRRGADLVGSALLRLVDDERRKRDLAAGAATLARQRLANCDWAISCARADLAQLELVQHPPSAPIYRPSVEIIKRPEPAWLQNFDPIEWPFGARPAADAVSSPRES
jgi:hypothetical protein